MIPQDDIQVISQAEVFTCIRTSDTCEEGRRSNQSILHVYEHPIHVDEGDLLFFPWNIQVVETKQK